MEQAITSIFALGWIDFFNPVAISTVLLLVPLVRRSWHTLLYVFGTYVAYAVAGVAIYFGVDRWLSHLWRWLNTAYPAQVNLAAGVVGLLAAAGCVLMIRFLVRAARQHRELTMESMLCVRSVAPWFIVLLSFGSTWSNIFSAMALFAYIGVLAVNAIPMHTAMVLLPIFCLFSLVPTLAVYLLATRVKGQRLQRILSVIRKVVTGFCFYSIPVVLALIAWWGIARGLTLFL